MYTKLEYEPHRHSLGVYLAPGLQEAGRGPYGAHTVLYRFYTSNETLGEVGAAALLHLPYDGGGWRNERR